MEIKDTSRENSKEKADLDARRMTADEFNAAYRECVDGDLAAWHFPMMNDPVRNSAYEKALSKSVKGALVLDIGTGSGLLAMMAVRHGATRVITCEELPSIAEKAREIIRQNGFAERIQVVNRLSTDLVIGKDLPERADVLVTEIFDDGLLGERAFKAIGHAQVHLLKPQAQIIPMGARVIAMAIESREIFENHRVDQASGFDLRAFNALSFETYTGYHLQKMEHRALSAPAPVFDFDFKKIPGPQSIPFEFVPTQTGLCHAIAYWFELRLDPEIQVTTAPNLPRLSCWKQAIQLLDQPRKLVEGERTILGAHHDSEAIWFT